VSAEAVSSAKGAELSNVSPSSDESSSLADFFASSSLDGSSTVDF